MQPWYTAAAACMLSREQTNKPDRLHGSARTPFIRCPTSSLIPIWVLVITSLVAVRAMMYVRISICHVPWYVCRCRRLACKVVGVAFREVSGGCNRVWKRSRIFCSCLKRHPLHHSECWLRAFYNVPVRWHLPRVSTVHCL